MICVQEAVDNINEKLFEDPISDSLYFRYLELTRTPSGDFIKYMGLFIWDSENDYREWADDAQEPLEQYLVKQIIEVNKVVVETLRVVDVRYKAFAKVMDGRLKGKDLRKDMLRRDKEFLEEQKK